MDQRKRVLIIDDDPTILDTARRLLEREGLAVSIYSDGLQATSFAELHRPDLVLIDVNMPLVSGDNLAARFKGHESLSSIPIVLFSSNEEGALRRMAKAVGASGYISKSEMGASFGRRVQSFLADEKN